MKSSPVLSQKQATPFSEFEVEQLIIAPSEEVYEPPFVKDTIGPPAKEGEAPRTNKAKIIFFI